MIIVIKNNKLNIYQRNNVLNSDFRKKIIDGDKYMR